MVHPLHPTPHSLHPAPFPLFLFYPPPLPHRQLSRVSSSVSLLLPPRGLLDLADGMCRIREFSFAQRRENKLKKNRPGTSLFHALEHSLPITTRRQTQSLTIQEGGEKKAAIRIRLRGSGSLSFLSLSADAFCETLRPTLPSAAESLGPHSVWRRWARHNDLSLPPLACARATRLLRTSGFPPEVQFGRFLSREGLAVNFPDLQIFSLRRLSSELW